MKIEPDDFAIWRDNPITVEFFRALRNLAEEAKAEWLEASWDKGNCDEKLLIDLRATALVAIDICEMTLEDMETFRARKD